MQRIARTYLIRLSTAGFAVGLCGCATVPDLPAQLEVALSATERASAAAGTGPAALAGTSWTLTRVADGSDDDSAGDGGTGLPGPYGGLLSGMALERPPAGELIFIAQFGAAGQMIHVSENRFILPDVYGSEIPIGGEWIGAVLPGVFYRSESYGVQQGDVLGLAVVVNVRFRETYLGQAVLYAWGVVSGDQLEGMFGYVLDFSEGAVSGLGTVADQYPVTGQRVAP